MNEIQTEGAEGFPELFQFNATTYDHPARIHHWVHRECAVIHGWDGKENPLDEPSNDPGMICQVCGKPGTVEDSQQIRFLAGHHDNFLGSLAARRFVRELSEAGIQCEAHLPDGNSDPVPDPKHEHLPTPLEQRLIDGGMYNFEAHEHAGRTYSDGPMTPRLLAEKLMMVRPEYLDMPIVVGNSEGTTFRLYGPLVEILSRNHLGYFDCPPSATLESGRLVHQGWCTALILGAKLPTQLAFWAKQEELLAVHGGGCRSDRWCHIHRRPYPSKRWDECPHCLRASGLTPEEVRSHIKETQ